MKFKLKMGLIGLLVAGTALAVWWWVWNSQPLSPKVDQSPKPEVTITTDKTEYEQGETVTIVVRNNLSKSIWYIKEVCPPSCCDLYKWENNGWRKLGDPISCIQLALPPSGGPYHVEPDELKPEETITKQWEMKTRANFAESGEYRLSFYYGLSEDKYTENTIYSSEFTIEKK